MSMPEASIHQNAGTILSEHNIRFSWQPWMIEPIPESPSPQELPDKNLRFGILALDCRHVIVALFYGFSNLIPPFDTKLIFSHENTKEKA